MQTEPAPEIPTESKLKQTEPPPESATESKLKQTETPTEAKLKQAPLACGRGLMELAATASSAAKVNLMFW